VKAKRKPIQFYLLCTLLLLAFTSEAQPVTKIATGGQFNLFLKSDGSLWGMGRNDFGELGDGTYNTSSPHYGTNQPEQIVISGVTKIAAGDSHSLFLKSDGSLWAMGFNHYGGLGDGTYSNTNSPEQIVSSGVTAIAAGDSYSLFLKSDGSLWAMGYNGYGGLGDGTYNNTNSAEQIVASGVTAISARGLHSMFIKSDGSLWVMGDNMYGQLGDGIYNLVSPYGTNHPQQIVSSGVTAIAAGYSHSLFLKSDGSLWAMGLNNEGQLGDGTYNNANSPEFVASGVIAIAAGDNHSFFIKSDGSLWAMGYNQYGQLGDGTYSSNAPYFATNRPELIVASNITAIAGGNAHSIFLKSDGSLWAMGQNFYAQLGDGTFNNTNRPEQIVVNSSYNQISGQLLSGGNMSLSFFGNAGVNYALDRSFNLAPPNWIPQVTNSANSFGALVFTNTPVATTNNFWRIRSVP